MKLLLKLAALAAVLFALVALAGWFLVPPAARGAVEKGSQYAFGVPTTLTRLGASLGFGTSGMELEGYRVASPEGFGDKPLLEVGTLALGVGTRSLMGDPKVIDELRLEGLELHLIQKGTANNLLPVLQHARRLAGGGADTPGKDAPKGEGGPRLRIEKVKIAGLAATVDLSDIPGLGSLSKRFELPAYEADWSALSGADGVTVAELASKLLDEVSASAMNEADKHLSPLAAQLLRSTVEGGLEGGLRGGLDAARGAAEEKARDAVEKGLGKIEKEAENQLNKLKEGVKEKLPIGDLLPDGAKLPDGVDAGKVQEKAADEVEKAAAGAEKALEKGLEKGTKALEGILGGTQGTDTAPGAGATPQAPAAGGAPGTAGEAVEKARKGLGEGAKKLLGNKGGG